MIASRFVIQHSMSGLPFGQVSAEKWIEDQMKASKQLTEEISKGAKIISSLCISSATYCASEYILIREEK